MKTIGQHVSNIRALIKRYSRTEEGYTDETLYNLFSISANEVRRQQLLRFQPLIDDNWYKVCMKLQVSKSHNCDCVPEDLDCKILKSNYKIPSTLIGRNIPKIKISTIGGKQINILSEEDWHRRKDLETTDYFGSIINSYLVIWNAPLILKVVQINGLWNDVLELSNIPNCSSNGEEEGVCFDPLTTEYPLPDDLAGAAYSLLLKKLQIPEQILQDQTNDSNESIKM